MPDAPVIPTPGQIARIRQRTYLVEDIVKPKWVRIVMGQDEVTKLMPNDDAGCRPNLPKQFVEQLSFSVEIL